MSNNENITSLAGLESVGPNTISNLVIYNNPLLSQCDVKSVCKYLLDVNGTASISDNESGCNNRSEVETSCGGASVDESGFEEGYLIYPVPAINQITLKSDVIPVANTYLTIHNIIGQEVLHQMINGDETHIDISAFNKGIYTFRIHEENDVIVLKLIKE